VTGASRGIGRAIALAMAREGADLIVSGRDVPELQSLEATVSEAGRSCLVIVADLAEELAVEHLWREVERHGRAVDILVNNAGIGSGASPRPVVSFDDDFWDLTLRVNLTVPYQLSKRALPAMVERGYGRVIAIASISAFRPGVHDSAYAASKSGLVGLTRVIAREHIKDGVTSNAICPGTTVTRTADVRLHYEAQRLGKSFDAIDRSISPLGRRIMPEEVAPMAVYLASPEAACVTGQTFVIDGGQLN
jgi:NAD(P)-dependent dehydrogenase (short-subunit alcohol dehydrogenase family)